MVIIIGNQKGGAGKSTLTLLLANYLSITKRMIITVVDMDYQQSLTQKYIKAKLLENKEPYQVVAANLEDYPTLSKVFISKADEVALIDLPGKLDDDRLIAVFRSADLVICPFSYDEFSFDSTVLFSVVIKKINPGVQIAYIPNRVKANVRYETMTEVNEQLVNFGTLMPSIPDRIDFQRVSTFQTPLSLLPLVTPVFEQLYAYYLNTDTDE
jgi:chromosome partitioning protein